MGPHHQTYILPPSFTKPTVVIYLRIMVNGPLSNDEVIQTFPS